MERETNTWEKQFNTRPAFYLTLKFGMTKNKNFLMSMAHVVFAVQTQSTRYDTNIKQLSHCINILWQIDFEHQFMHFYSFLKFWL